MSVLIKGMNMPYGCANCDFVGSPIYDSKGRAIYSCNVPVDGIRGKNVTEQVIDMYEGGGGDYFPDWCPLTDLDKHGRLGDLDALIKFIEDRYEITWESDCYEGGIKDACNDILEKIDTMPTIVESEDRE